MTQSLSPSSSPQQRERIILQQKKGDRFGYTKKKQTQNLRFLFRPIASRPVDLIPVCAFVYHIPPSGERTMSFRAAAPLFTWLLLLLVAAAAMASNPTSPAFLWSPHYPPSLTSSSESLLGGGVNYQTISSKDLAKSLMFQAGWSTLLCSEKEHHPQPLDLALIFVGRELSSSDVSTNNNADSSLMYLLKDSFTRSNFSMAFPYVATTSDERIENALVSEFVETCRLDSGMPKIAISESCSVQGQNLDKLSNLDAVNEYMVSMMEKRQTGVADVVVICTGEPHFVKGLEQYHSESETFSKLISFVESVKAKYAVLYVSNPLTSIQYPSHRSLERFLAEGGLGNGSLNSTFCDEICQIKSSLLEGALVAIVLLVILISGLCCMMGIDTPTRFEAPQES